MGRYSNYPTLYDEVLQINISKLKGWGYIKSNNVRSGTLTWTINGEKHSAINIYSNTNYNYGYIELSYKSDGESINYKVRLVTIPSNLGKGFIWYFQCPHTLKLCRKLYLVGGYFLHREAFEYCMYESQTVSKSYRNLARTFKRLNKLDQLYSELNSKNFKKTYAGKPTKRYLKLLCIIKQAEKLSYKDIESLLVNGY